ncbi:MAG: deoxyribose-phosphate aldolase [Bdellovibrionota bacterium]
MQSTRVPAKPSDLAPFIDHTLLKADACTADIEKLCEEAVAHSFKAVCVNPVFVKLARQKLGSSGVLVASVIGFPLGAHSSAVKAEETRQAVADGAAEIDMVIRIDFAREARWKELESDIRSVVQAAGSARVKVILETGLLDKASIVEACKASERAGAAFVKTATGFLGRGATVEDIETMRKSVSEKIEIKASGGVKTFAQAIAMIEAGATRIGTSSGVALVTGTAAGSGY